MTDWLPHWVVTFEPRSEGFDLDAAGVAQLSSDLATIAGLCDYLQQRTDAAMHASSGGGAETTTLA